MVYSQFYIESVGMEIAITGSSGSTQNTSLSWTWGDRSGSSLDSILYVILYRKDKTGSSQVQLGLIF